MMDPPVPPADCVDGNALLAVLASVKAGDFSARMPLAWTGVPGKVADDLNEVIIANEALQTELARISRVVGRQGELSQRAVLGGRTQSWSAALESVNTLIDELARPTSEMQRVIGAVAHGDLSKKVAADVNGEMLELKQTINAMVDQLNGFVSEVSRVAREVGTEGKLGQAAAFTTEVGGVWKDLTDDVNLMADNLTGQVRNIAEVTTAVANGDLSKKISIDTHGEFLELKSTVNSMVDHLKTFSGEVTRVAREVGVDGKLGGQAQSEEVGGVWKDLTDNVNQLAANLTRQVRAIAEVATAVTAGDLSRQVQMEASGEVAALEDTLNAMIRNLRETTEHNVEQDWLKTHREQFIQMLQVHDDLTEVSNTILSELARLVRAQYGALYTLTGTAGNGGEAVLELTGTYGFEDRPHVSTTFGLGEGLVGQCAKEGEAILLTDVPAGYVRISSGLGKAHPSCIIIIPVLFKGTVRAVIELASFWQFTATHQAFLDSVTRSIGISLTSIQAAGVTGALLQQSQSQAEELRASQDELRGTNADLARQATLLSEQYLEAEQKNAQVEKSKRLIEEQVSQLALSSQYKSEFIANMSHELRTPLNTLLLLAQQLEDNSEGNLSETQVEYAGVILSSGRDLMELLNSILDLAKVESGTVAAENAEVDLKELRASLLREFGPVAQQQGLSCTVDLAEGGPQSLVTDPQRLRQILKNLLANALKFTERGGVRLRIGLAEDAGGGEDVSLVSFAVSDTGIGIDAQQQQRIFEAFAQGDGSTSRLYGGTGLGLSISRELVGLLGGRLEVSSSPGQGSTFTLELPTQPPRLAKVTALTQGHEPAAVADPGPLFRTPAQRVVPPGSKRADRSIDGVSLLVVHDRPLQFSAIETLLKRGGGHVTVVASAAEATTRIAQQPDVDILLIDAALVTMGDDVVGATRAAYEAADEAHLPVVAIAHEVIAGERERCLGAGADGYLVLPLQEVGLFAAVRSLLPASRTPEGADGRPHPAIVAAPDLHALTAVDGVLHGLTALVVDDDFRNIFAMTAVLERGRATVRSAESGAQAIDVLQHVPGIDIVLMDIMMPVLDGYDTMRAIRKLPGLELLPMVAITGKAGAGERRRCLDAGADDYLAKPVDAAQLLATITPWLPLPRTEAVL